VVSPNRQTTAKMASPDDFQGDMSLSPICRAS
jgi:hypothetical protein